MILNHIYEHTNQYECHVCFGVAAVYLIYNPGTMKMAILRRLPPAQACRWSTASERDLEGHQVSLVTAVAVQEFLKKSPAQPSIHGKLQEHWLRAWIRRGFSTAQSQKKLNKPVQWHIQVYRRALVYMFEFILYMSLCLCVEYLALDKSRSKVSSIRRPSSLKNRWLPLVVMPHFLEGFPPLINLKCSDSKTPPTYDTRKATHINTTESKHSHIGTLWANKLQLFIDREIVFHF